MNTPTWDHAAARERLKALTTDPDILDGLERAIRTDRFDDAFLDAFYGANLSLDWVLLGVRNPQRDRIAEIIEKFERLDEKQQLALVVLMELMVSDPEVQKLDAEGISAVYQRLLQKPGEADAASA